MADVAFQSFDLGRTFYNGASIDTSSSYANAGNVSYLGRSRVFSYKDPTDPVKSTGEDVHAIVVQNRSGINLLPSRVAAWSSTGYGKWIGGYTSAAAGLPAGIVDPYLPATGVPDGDLFWLIVRGPCLVYRSLGNLAGADLAVGDIVFAVAAATSQATSAGRFEKLAASFSATETTNFTAYNMLANAIGRARSVATTNANTTAKILVDVRIR